MIVWNAKLFIAVPKVVDGNGKEMNATECHFSRGMHERAELRKKVFLFFFTELLSYSRDCSGGLIRRTVYVAQKQKILISFKESRHSS